MKIELENILQKAMNEGVNLFLGAGFSIDATNKSKENLPLGGKLAEEIASKFKTPKLDLPKVSQIVESRNKDEFYEFLTSKFDVQDYDVAYSYLEKLTIKNIFTTNIDNLIFRIFEKSKRYYINDTTFQGPSFQDIKAIDYYPLHGCIINRDRPLVFTPMALSSAFTRSPWIWDDLKKSIANTPTIFWGYSLADPGILETLDTLKVANAERKEKWIVLHEDKPDEEEYFKSIGFNIIIASNKDFFDYINRHVTPISNKTGRKSTRDLFGEEFVPSDTSKLPVREITNFYLGAAPIWFDIIRPDTYKTSHFRKILNNIFSNKNNIVIGIPGSGKTTLLMQLAANIDIDAHKIILEFPTIERAQNIINILGDENAIVFVDNFTEEIQSFLLFHNAPNVKLIGFGREHNFEIISHFINRKEFNIHSVTSITQQDAQEIYNRLPSNIKTKVFTNNTSDDTNETSLFEFVNENLNFPNISDRYRDFMLELETKDELLVDFLVMSSYVHSCGTPLSFDMTYSYFSNDVTSYAQIYEMREKLGQLLIDKPLTIIDEENQDYFMPRSMILAETIIKQVPSKLLKRVLNIFLDNLPPYKIINYRAFRKKAHDKSIINKAFPDWEEGKEYYEDLIEDDKNNYFLWQQGALYLSQKKQYNLAFIWIEQARNMSNNRVTSIKNSHAIILFDANINREGYEVQESLDRSMEILKDCYFEDKRKIYHAKRFAYQAINYYERFASDIGRNYLKQAENWLKDEIKDYAWDRELGRQLKEVENKLK